MPRKNRLAELALEHPDRWARDSEGNIVCENCGSSNLKADGNKYRDGVKFPRIKCKDCGKSSTGQTPGRPREEDVGDSAIRMRRLRARRKGKTE